MSDRNRDLFPEIEPLPGGLEALRARLDRSDRDRSRRRAMLVAGALAAAVILTVLAIRTSAPSTPEIARTAPTLAPDPVVLRKLVANASHPGLISIGLQAAPIGGASSVPGHDANVTFRRIPTSTDEVVYYVAETDG